MRKSIFVLVLALALFGCARKDGIVLFGVKLGDDARNAPKGEFVSSENGRKRYRYEHTPELDGEWKCYYVLQGGKVVMIDCYCEGEGCAKDNFNICRDWIKKNVPYKVTSADGDDCFTVWSDTTCAMCQINNYSHTVEILVGLVGKPKKQKDGSAPDLSK